MNNKLLVVVTLMADECVPFQDTIATSLQNLSRITDDFEILFVIQSNEHFKLPEKLAGFNGKVILIKESCLSRARNEGISFAQENKFSFIIFHDTSIVFSENFASYVHENLNKKNVLSGQLSWSLNTVASSILKGKLASVNIMKHHYVGSYVLPVSMIDELRFNEKVGPGRDTYLKNGEDVVFLSRFFSKNKLSQVFYCENALVLHPPRPSDRSKEIYYAIGQGALYRYFFQKGVWRFGVLTHSVLFWGNALLSLIFRRKSFKVLVLRLEGFFSTRYKHFYE